MTTVGLRALIGASFHLRRHFSIVFIHPLTIVALTLFSGGASLHAAGTVVAWGDNHYSQTNVPSVLTGALTIASGSYHSLAVDLSANVLGWGDASHGETTAPTNLTGVITIAGGNGFSLALRGSGNVVAFGSQISVPAGLSNVVGIAAAGENALGLTRDGAVLPWGTLTVLPAFVTNAVAIAAGYTHYLALAGDGTVRAWGDSSQGKTTVPSGLTDAVALAGGRFHSLALRSDGTVTAWGDNSYNELAVPAGLSNVIAISAGGVHSLALKGDGTVVAWGDDSYGQLDAPPNLTNIAGIAAGRYHNAAIIGDGAPFITVQPVARYDAVTKKATFQTMAGGTQPLRYQWLQDGTPISGGTNSILVLTDLATVDAGIYSVIISNSLGLVESSSTTLPPAWRRPFVLNQTADVSIPCGEEAVFTVDVIGSEPLSFQWYFEKVVIEGATNQALVLDRARPDLAGMYQVIVTNANGYATSQVASLTVLADPPLITSTLTASGKQGVPFTYTIAGLHEPTSYSATGLPFGLSVDTTTGKIQGTPVDAGVFAVKIGTATLCSSASTNITLSIQASWPAITSSTTVVGIEQSPFTYKIIATESPDLFDAQGLPQGLSVDPVTGLISGSPLYAGEFTSLISASNSWGMGTVELQISISNAPIMGLAIENVITNYISPYLLDFQFSLRDGDDSATSHAVVANPGLLTATGLEDDVTVSPSETAVIVQSAKAKVLKAYLVLDLTESVASPANGDSNHDGISDAVDAELGSAQGFVNAQPLDAQIGVYEFHREDLSPYQVVSLTSDKALLNDSIAGIWTNYVMGFPAGSRCWDALVAAIQQLGAPNPDEQHYAIFVSDGRDESSTNTMDDVISQAITNNVQVYCVGFGAELDSTTLQAITSQTSGRYYEATNAADLASDFAQIGKDLSGRYILRWATLKRSTNAFMPSFQISYQGFTAASPPNPPPIITGTNEVVDTSTDPPTTNFVPVYTTNYLISPYQPTAYAGDVTVGSLRLVADADVHPSGVTLRATYVPRYIRQILLHYRANWPCTASLQSTNLGEVLYGWSLAETDDGEGGKWLLIDSADPQVLTTSIPFASFGKLITFTFRDLIAGSNAFSVFGVDNTIYTNTGGQSFVFENTDAFITSFAVLPHGTPVPWLQGHGFTGDLAAAELDDPDGDGALNWQEYQANTDPNDFNSKFIVKSVAPTDSYGRYQITFTTAINRTYRVESSDDVVTWKPLVENIRGTGNDITFTDIRNPAESQRVFYRVVVN